MRRAEIVNLVLQGLDREAHQVASALSTPKWRKEWWPQVTLELASRIWSDVTDLIGVAPDPDEICAVMRILTDVADDTRLTAEEEEAVKERVLRLTASHDLLFEARIDFEMRRKGYPDVET